MSEFSIGSRVWNNVNHTFGIVVSMRHSLTPYTIEFEPDRLGADRRSDGRYWTRPEDLVAEMHIDVVKPVTSDKASETLTNERKSTHGDWVEQSELALTLKLAMHEAPNWATLTSMQSEALDMIAVKISRILSGNPSEPDHWDDIGGYAHLGKGGHK